MFIALHEDVSRVTTKPRITKEAASAREAWSQYTSREDSTVVDLCVGQLKSSLTCSSCGYVSEVCIFRFIFFYTEIFAFLRQKN